jgi:hypothetical protein
MGQITMILLLHTYTIIEESNVLHTYTTVLE